MKENFEKAVNFILSVEGGYVNDIEDKGGETKYGISQNAFPELKIIELTEEQAKEIYKTHYWDTCQGDLLPEPFDIAVFDCAVNQGPQNAIISLQRVLNINADGIIGNMTLEACKAAGEKELRKFLLSRLWKYTNLKNFNRFGRGWYNRLIKLSEIL